MTQPVTTSQSFFEDRGNHQYVLNPDKLPPGMCHLFYPMPSEEMWITTALEYSTFHPNTPLNQLFDVEVVQAGAIKLFHCSFPEKFKCLCERIGQIFQMTVSYDPKAIVFGSSPEESLTYLHMHSTQNVLLFDKATRFPQGKDDATLQMCHRIHASLDEITHNGTIQVNPALVCDRLASLSTDG